MANAEQCQRYAASIKTSTGQTLEDPVGWVATFFDYDEWRSVATRFVETAEANASILFQAGGALDAAVGDQLTKIREKLKALPSFWDLEVGSFKMTSYADASAIAYTLAQEAACLLADIEDRTLAVGGSPLIPWKGIPVPKPEDSSYLDELAEGASTGLVLLLGLWLWDRSKN